MRAAVLLFVPPPFFIFIVRAKEGTGIRLLAIAAEHRRGRTMPTVSDRGAIHDAVKQGTSTLARLAAMSSPTDAAAQHAAAQQAIGASELRNHALLLAAPPVFLEGEV